jgi:hypothetical protein
VIKNEVRKLDDFGRLFWRQRGILSHAAFGGGGLPNLKGGDCLGKHPLSDGRFLEELEYFVLE